MKTKEKQIEEMAVILTDGGCTKCNCDENGKFNCLPMYNAELIYNAGYRKTSEVAREIFDEIERTFKGLLNGDISNILKLLSTLKNEYTEQKLEETEKALKDMRKEDEWK